MDNDALHEEGMEMLKRISPSAADLRHAKYYANMAPEKKIERLLRLRALQVRAIKSRLRDENPYHTEKEIHWLFLNQLDSLRDLMPHIEARRIAKEKLQD